jgi:hypothetical protein
VRYSILTGGIVGLNGVHEEQCRSHIVSLTLASEENVSLVVGGAYECQHSLYSYNADRSRKSLTIGVNDLRVGWHGGDGNVSGSGSIGHGGGIGERDLLDN